MGMTAKTRIRDIVRREERAGRCAVAPTSSDERQMNRLVEHGELLRPFPRLFASPEHWKELDAASQHANIVRALGKLHPDWIFCDVSAAVIHGLRPSYELLDKVHVISSASPRYDAKPRVVKHEIKNPEEVSSQGVRVTSIARTATDCMRRLSFADGLAIADAACSHLNWSAQQLEEHVASLARAKLTNGIEHALVTASYADGRAESGGESIARASFVQLGYQMPELQVYIPNPFDSDRYSRPDFLWLGAEGGPVDGELDGKKKYHLRRPRRTNGRLTTSEFDAIYDEKMRDSQVSVYSIRSMRFSSAQGESPDQLEPLLQAYGIPMVAPRCDEPERNQHDGLDQQVGCPNYKVLTVDGSHRLGLRELSDDELRYIRRRR